MGHFESFKSFELNKGSPINTIAISKKVAGGIGLTPEYLSFRNTYWGQEHPVPYDLLWKAYVEDPVVHGAVNTLVEAIIGDGWTVIGGNKEEQQKFYGWLASNNWANALRDIVTCLILYGDAYIELVKEGDLRPKFTFVTRDGANGEEVLEKAFLSGGSLSPSEALEAFEDSSRESSGGVILEFYPRDPASIRIDYNEHGEPIKYIQRVLHRRVDFYPDQMIHLTINTVGNRQYGLSSLATLLQTLQAKLNAERYTTDYFKKGALPRSTYILPRYYSQEEQDKLATTVRNLRPQDDLMIVGEEVKIETVAPSNQDLQYSELLDYLRLNILIALGVPPTLVGITEGSNRANSVVQMEAFDRRVRSLRTQIEGVFNSILFTANNTGLRKLSMKFMDLNTRERLKRAQEAQLLSTIAAISPNEVREVLGLPDIDSLDPEDRKFVEEKIISKPDAANQGVGAAVSGKRSIEHEQRANDQNVEQASQFKSVVKAYGAAILSMKEKELLQRAKELSEKLRSGGVSREDRKVMDDIREIMERLSQVELLDNSSSGHPLEMQGTADVIPTYGDGKNTTNVSGGDGSRSYPFGATQMERENTAQVERMRSDWSREVRDRANNTDYLDLNQDPTMEPKERGKDPNFDTTRNRGKVIDEMRQSSEMDYTVKPDRKR